MDYCMYCFIIIITVIMEGTEADLCHDQGVIFETILMSPKSVLLWVSRDLTLVMR